MATTSMTGEPYELAGSRMPFLNWYYVKPGAFGWYDASGKNVSVVGDVGPTEAGFRPRDRPMGIRLTARKAERQGPIVRPELPWEGIVDINTAIQSPSGYQAWGSCRTRDGKSLAAYFESEDGREWRRPELGLVEYDGSVKNNFVQTTGGNLSTASIFVDPSAPPEERYKAIAGVFFTRAQFEAYCKRRPGYFDPKAFRVDVEIDPNSPHSGNICGARGWVSPDGFRWTAIEEPLVVMHTDTQVVCYYDTRLRKYVGYFRDFLVGPRSEVISGDRPSLWLSPGRRSIGRAETDDFRDFPLSETVLDPRLDMLPSQVLYTNCKTTFPGAPDQHLLFPAIWDQGDDTTSIDLATSHDGKTWGWVPGTPLFETATFGAWDGGTIFARPDLLELPDGSFALPYTGYNVPHKYPRGQWGFGPGYAIWPKGRLLALEAAGKGEFATVAVIPPGQRLSINAVTRRAGFIQVEAAGLDGKPIPGREFENAVPLVGDCYGTPIVWKGHDDLGVQAGEAVMLRFRMEMASLYFVEFA